MDNYVKHLKESLTFPYQFCFLIDSLFTIVTNSMTHFIFKGRIFIPLDC